LLRESFINELIISGLKAIAWPFKYHKCYKKLWILLLISKKHEINWFKIKIIETIWVSLPWAIMVEIYFKILEFRRGK